jgi:hypothetical protein
MNPNNNDVASLKEQIRLLKVENQRLKAENAVYRRVNEAYSPSPEYFPDHSKHGFSFGTYDPIWIKATA